MSEKVNNPAHYTQQPVECIEFAQHKIQMKMKITLPELGYTPANLRMARKQANLTQHQVADITGTKSVDMVRRWEMSTDRHMHSTMPHMKWLLLLDAIVKLSKQ